MLFLKKAIIFKTHKFNQYFVYDELMISKCFVALFLRNSRANLLTKFLNPFLPTFFRSPKAEISSVKHQKADMTLIKLSKTMFFAILIKN
jgi:hypothetical protein